MTVFPPVLRQEFYFSAHSPFPFLKAQVPRFYCKAPQVLFVCWPRSGAAELRLGQLEASYMSTGPSSAVMLVWVLGQTECSPFPQLGWLGT